MADEARDLLARFPAAPAPWDGVQHLWDHGRAPLRPDHPDHELAQVLLNGFLAELLCLTSALLLETLLARGFAASGRGNLNGRALAELLAQQPR